MVEQTLFQTRIALGAWFHKFKSSQVAIILRPNSSRIQIDVVFAVTLTIVEIVHGRCKIGVY